MHICEVEKLDACTRPFANLVTYIINFVQRKGTQKAKAYKMWFPKHTV